MRGEEDLWDFQISRVVFSSSDCSLIQAITLTVFMCLKVVEIMGEKVVQMYEARQTSTLG